MFFYVPIFTESFQVCANCTSLLTTLMVIKTVRAAFYKNTIEYRSLTVLWDRHVRNLSGSP